LFLANPPDSARGDRATEIDAVLIKCGQVHDHFQCFAQVFDQNRE
jgi:hypothetical protein